MAAKRLKKTVLRSLGTKVVARKNPGKDADDAAKAAYNARPTVIVNVAPEHQVTWDRLLNQYIHKMEAFRWLIHQELRAEGSPVTYDDLAWVERPQDLPKDAAPRFEIVKGKAKIGKAGKETAAFDYRILIGAELPKDDKADKADDVADVADDVADVADDADARDDAGLSMLATGPGEIIGDPQ